MAGRRDHYQVLGVPRNADAEAISGGGGRHAQGRGRRDLPPRAR